MASISPGHTVPGPGFGDPSPTGAGFGGSDSGSSKGPLERLGFKLMMGEKKTRDGQPPKRRGPKPDSKPALTRRQELNRQAQRTHRERKEMYIKALEQEVLRLKDVFEGTVKERDAYKAENQRLKELLAAHGIHYSDLQSPGHQYTSGSSQFGDSSTSLDGAHRGSVSTGYTSPPSRSAPPIPGTSGGGGSPGFDVPPGQMQQMQQLPLRQNNGLDYDQIGIDFVLTLERPCMDHMQFLMVRSKDAEDAEISGHALMATCPPQSHINEHGMDVMYPQKMPDVGMPDLMKLLDLSARLPLDGEITPIMAWVLVRGSARFTELTQADFDVLKEDLKAKVRCYGFGAVLEEFEVEDALNGVLMKKEGSQYWSPPAGGDVKMVQ